MEKEKIPDPGMRRKVRQAVQELRLMDDDFMRLCLQNNKPAVQLILRVVLDKPNLEVQEVRTQMETKSPTGRSVRFDVWARDGEAVYNIEIEKSDAGAFARRARCYSAMLDSGLLKHGEDYVKLVESFVIFITENDIFRKGLPLYRFDRYCTQTEENLNDGSHIIYVNGQYRGEDAIGTLMSDFHCKNASQMVYTELAERVRYFKEDIEGEKRMCKIIEDFGKECATETKLETARRMLDNGKLSLSEVAECSGLTLEEVQKLAAEN